jgi:Flp pilus assembly protein TadG
MMLRWLRRMGSDERGAAAIELALTAPMLALAVIGIVDLSNAFSRKLGLEQGVQRAIEKIMQTTGTTTVAETLKSEVACQVNGLDTAGLCKSSPVTAADITVKYRLECRDSGGTLTYTYTTTTVTDFDAQSCSSTSKEARYIEVAAKDAYYPLFPIRFAAFSKSDGSYQFTAVAGVRTK